jgi:hypothetical protein
MVTADVDAFLETSAQFVGRWNHLISTSNWEKGRIISQWRISLADAGAPAGEYADEVWAKRVGGVSPQHVGRLRRVFDRFDEVRGDYEGLYWSHFHAAVDWEDAEMWLEGGVQNGWSVKQMMNQRWETLGSPEGSEPSDEDVVASEPDEDIETNPTADSEMQGEVAVVEDVGSDADDEYDKFVLSNRSPACRKICRKRWRCLSFRSFVTNCSAGTKSLATICWLASMPCVRWR